MQNIDQAIDKINDIYKCSAHQMHNQKHSFTQPQIN